MTDHYESGGDHRDPIAARILEIVFESVDPQSPEALQSMQNYFKELDQLFPAGFEPGSTVTDDADLYRPPNGVFIVAKTGSDLTGSNLAGCGGVHRMDDMDNKTAEVKRMWVNPSFRGHRVGRRLLEQLEQEARLLGCSRIVLDTNATLTAAISMYQSAGYQDIDRYNDNPFAQRWFQKYL